MAKKLESIKLEIDGERAKLDAETGKHRYGARSKSTEERLIKLAVRLKREKGIKVP